MVGVRAKGRRVAAGHLAYARDDYSLRREHKIRGEGGHKTRGFPAGARVSSLGREGEAGKAEANKTGRQGRGWQGRGPKIGVGSVFNAGSLAEGRRR